MTPRSWRIGQNLSQAAAAALAGVGGRNPARTWSRWELGEREPPLRVVAKIQDVSAGEICAGAWAEVREAFVQRQGARL